VPDAVARQSSAHHIPQRKPKEPSVSAHTLATRPNLVARYHARLQPTTEPAQDTMAIRLTGASMRLLEVSLAVVAIATALLAGVGR
jgi:hypothetical protein